MHGSAAFILADTEVIKRVFPAAIIMPLPDRNEAHYRQILQILFDMSRAAIVENPRRGKKTAEGRKSKGGRDLLRTHEAKAAEWIGGITGVREKDKSVTIEVMESVLPFFERLYESNNIGLFQSCGLDAAPTDPTLFKAWAQEVLLYYGVRGCSRGLDYLVKHREKFLATYGG